MRSRVSHPVTSLGIPLLPSVVSSLPSPSSGIFGARSQSRDRSSSPPDLCQPFSLCLIVPHSSTEHTRLHHDLGHAPVDLLLEAFEHVVSLHESCYSCMSRARISYLPTTCLLPCVTSLTKCSCDGLLKLVYLTQYWWIWDAKDVSEWLAPRLVL